MGKWIFLLLVLTGCGGRKDKCGKDFLVLWPGADGTYQFQPVRLSTLASPYELKGEAAQVYVESTLGGASGYSGAVARPHLTRADGMCVPTDIDSALAVSAYAQMERLYAFDRDLGVSGQIPWPRKVGVQIQLTGEETLVRNNALYFSKYDATALVPYTAGGLPAPVNLGIVAHEHFHAHFQHQVYGPLNAILAARELVYGLSLERLFHPLAARRPGAEDVDKAEVGSPRGLNVFVLRAWNEGLADFYSWVYTGRSGFVRESLPYDSERDLADPPSTLRSAKQFREDAKANHGVTVGYSYRQGTELARLLYRVAATGIETRPMLLTRILNQLPKVAVAVARRFDQDDMDFETVVPLLLEGMVLNPTVCGVLSSSLSKVTMDRSFASCSRI
jgi:hypothetical protein